MRKRGLRPRATIGLCFLVAACSSPPPIRGVLNAHQLHMGQQLGPVEVECSDGVGRTVGARDLVQLVTFETLGDCQSCQAHIDGLLRLGSDGRLPVADIVVYWAPRSDVPAFLSLNPPSRARPACRDTAGAFWNSPGISHTPVTVVLDHGIVTLIDDAPMATPADQANFLHDLRGAGVR